MGVGLWVRGIDIPRYCLPKEYCFQLSSVSFTINYIATRPVKSQRFATTSFEEKNCSIKSVDVVYKRKTSSNSPTTFALYSRQVRFAEKCSRFFSHSWIRQDTCPNVHRC